jgi:predicted dienelactone hydrolase
MPAPDLSCQTFLGDAGAGISLEGNRLPAADPRIRAFVLLAPGAAGGFTPATLAGIRAPVLIVGAVDDDVTDYAANSALLAGAIAGARLTRIETDHFAFIPRCNWKGKVVARSLCQNGGDERARLHGVVSDEVMAFLARAVVAP